MLSISLTRGPLVQRDSVSTSLHPSYEVTFHILNENPTSLIDYRSDFVQHSFQYVFSNFRKLYETLVELNMELTAKFPPPHAKSSLGISLSEQQLQQRCSQLSDWFDCLMDNFTKLSVPAQAVVLTFCKLDARLDSRLVQQRTNAQLIEAVSKTSARDRQIGDIDKILELLNVPGSIYHPVSPVINLSLNSHSLLTNDPNGERELQNAEASSGDSADAKGQPTTGTASVVGTSTKGSDRSDEEPPSSSKFSSVGGGKHVSLTKSGNISSKGSIVGSDDVNVKFKGEVIRDNLCIVVERGLDIPKKTDDEDGLASSSEKKHISYLTTISIINSEIQFKPAFKQTTFDNYRSLCQSLAKLEVSNESNAKYMISADFPTTYRKSSFGLSLSPKEIEDRASGIQNWLCAIFNIYPDISDDAQFEIKKFFEMHADNPTEPQYRAILEILHPDWTSSDNEVRINARNRVLLKADSRPTTTLSPSNAPQKNKLGAIGKAVMREKGALSMFSRSKGDNSDMPVQEIGGEMEAPPMGCGVSCAIM